MSSKRELSPHGKLVSQAQLGKSADKQDRAEQRSELMRARDKRTGKFLAKMQPEDWSTVLERIACGDIEANICRDVRGDGTLSIARCTINEYRKRNPEFNEAYEEALFNGFINVAHDTRAIARGIEGYSTGDARRDELVVKTDMDLAKRFAARILGDRLQIDQKTIQVMIDGDKASEWGGKPPEPDDIEPQN